MKKIVVAGMFVLGTSLFAEVTTVATNIAFLNYTDAKKSSATLFSTYFNTGTLSYLTEFSYVRTDITYNNSTTALSQDEFTFIYKRYFEDYSYKFGLHMNSTTDRDLENGTTTILGIGAWNYFGYSKLSYGLDYYYSTYANATDLSFQKNSIIVNELSGYMSYYTPFQSFSNLFAIKINYESIEVYEESYTSFELSNKFYIGDAEIALKGFFGKMQTGIREGGMVVYNSKDVLKSSLSINFGYHLDESFMLDISYTQIQSDEYLSNEIITSVIAVGASYKL